MDPQVEVMSLPNNPQIHKLRKQKTPQVLAMQIHQQFGYASFQKIKLAFGNKILHRIVAPISDILRSVFAFQNLRCED